MVGQGEGLAGLGGTAELVVAAVVMMVLFGRAELIDGVRSLVADIHVKDL